jgi:hypothetical protein
MQKEYDKTEVPITTCIVESRSVASRCNIVWSIVAGNPVTDKLLQRRPS